MSEPPGSWDLDALDQAATRARLWRWLPLGVVSATVLGYLGLLGLGLVALATRDLRWMVPGVIGALTPLLGGIGLQWWHLRRLRAQLPGDPPPLVHRVFRPILLIWLALAGGLIVSWTDGIDQTVLGGALAGTIGILPFSTALRPAGRWFSPRWSGLALTGGSTVALALTLLLVTWLAPPTAFGLAGAAVALLGPVVATSLFARAADRERAAGDHEHALARLTHWRMSAFSTVIRARILVGAGRLEDAQAVCETYTQRSLRTEWPSLLALAARLALLLGDDDRAVLRTRALLAIAPDLPHGYILAADIAVRTEPDLAEKLLERGEFHYQRMAVASGATAALRASRRVDDARIAILRGRVHAALGRTDEAALDLQRALECIDREDRPEAAFSLWRAAELRDALTGDGLVLRDEAATLDPTGLGARLLALSAHAG